MITRATRNNSLYFFQVTVLTIRREAGGITPVPTPTWMVFGIEVDTIAAATKMECTGLNSEEEPTP